MIKIDFNELINKYDTNLLDNLRGFGSNQEYLKFWVPGTTFQKSFYNLIDALVESQHLEIMVSFDYNSFDIDFYNETELFLKKISSFQKEKENNLINFYIKIDANLYRQKKNENISVIKNEIEKKIDYKNKISVFRSKEKLNPIYEDGIEKISPTDYFEEKILESKNSFSKEIEGIQLNFIIENKNITGLAHNCKRDIILKKLINIFFDICINKNIQEAADHSAIYLEEKIRLNNKHLTKEGIILPSHAGTYFDDLNIVIRNVFSEYKIRESLEFEINKNYFKKSYHWINLEEVEKIKKINEIIFKVLNKNNLNANAALAKSIESNFRINLEIDKSFKVLQERKNLLLEIERKIKVLDQTLEVFIDESLDKNKLRIKNSPQTKLLN